MTEARWLQEPWYETFHDLMPVRVQEILVVSSPYDAFVLEEDGRLTERIFTEFSELNLSTAPRITHVPTAARAMELLSERRFDLVVTMARIADASPEAFAQRVKLKHPRMPVVLLVLAEADLRSFPEGVVPAVIDHVFWWTGDARILLAIVKCVEDARNVAHDTENAGVRVIVVVEDSVRRYSSFLSLLYAELMTQSASLIAEGVNDLHRLLRMRARPKLLLARTFEEATQCVERYRNFLVALITDVRFPREGRERDTAGFELVRLARGYEPDLPALIQSAEPKNRRKAEALGAFFLDKNAPDLLKQIRGFVAENLGFGDFVFRLPDRTEVGRARNLFELEDVLRSVPAESLDYHATRNHFSLWLMARCAFGLAKEVRPRSVEELGGVEDLRSYLLHVLARAREARQTGAISDYTPRGLQAAGPFVRLGMGSIGGKARGLAFVGTMLARRQLLRRFPGLDITIPRSLVIPTDEFDRHLERPMDAPLSEPLAHDLRQALSTFKGPLAVRSSSLLEDSRLLPFAGIYSTFMLPNNHPDPGVRFDEVVRALKAVFASTFSDEARAYLASTPFSVEEEKMAVLIQEVVGRRRDSRFYPTISGTAVSYNYYPLAPQRAEDGLVTVALGLGQTVAQGGQALQFSPANPKVLPQFGSTDDWMRHTQRRFWAIDLARPLVDFSQGPEASLESFGLDTAESDGTLEAVASAYQREDDALRDSLLFPGVRLVTFNKILKWGSLPLAPALQNLLTMFREGLGCPVELEFAVETAPVPTLYVLQVRPQTAPALEGGDQTGPSFEEDEVVCRSSSSMGHGLYDGLHDILHVSRDDLAPREMAAVAQEVGRLNERLREEGRSYLLIGPGRWGTSDPRLGVPVRWGQISQAKVIVETRFGDRFVEPSQGAHFFHNVTAFRLGYLMAETVDRRWIDALPLASERAGVRHYRLERSLRVSLNGREGTGVVLKPTGTQRPTQFSR